MGVRSWLNGHVLTNWSAQQWETIAWITSSTEMTWDLSSWHAPAKTVVDSCCASWLYPPTLQRKPASSTLDTFNSRQIRLPGYKTRIYCPSSTPETTGGCPTSSRLTYRQPH